MLIGLSLGQRLIPIGIDQAADAGNRNFDLATGFHGARANRGATADQVAGHQSLVLGQHRDDLLRAVNHVVDWVVLPGFVALDREHSGAG